MSYVNENIRILRNRMGLTQEKFAELMGINRKAIGAYEENRATPPLDKLYRMATLFGVTLDQLTQHRFAADAPLFEAPEEATVPHTGLPSQRKMQDSRPGKIPGQEELPQQRKGNHLPDNLQEESPLPPEYSSHGKGIFSDLRPEEALGQADPATPAEKKRPFSRTGHSTPAFEQLQENAIRYVSHKYFDKYILDTDFESRLGELPAFSFPFREEGRIYRAFDIPADSYIQEGIIIGERLSDFSSFDGAGLLLVVSSKKGILLRRLENTPNGEFIVKNEGREDFILRPADIREIWKPVGFFSRSLPLARPDLSGLSVKINTLKAQFDSLL